MRSGKNKMKKIINQLVLLLTITLIVFLPFSAWIVSLTGISELSLFRDALVLMIALLSLFTWSHQAPKLYKIATLLFFVWSILTIIWREASLAQWARGIRFTITPIFIFYILSHLKFQERQKRAIFITVLITGLIVSSIAILEVIGIKIPLTTHFSGAGALDATHFVGTAKILRLQAVLAGPNALGLYMVALAAIVLAWGRQYLSRWYYPIALLFSAIGILTFSRSAMIALALVWVLFKWRYLVEKTSKLWVWVGVGLLVLYFIAKFTVLINIPALNQFVTHDTSNSYRIEQYQRIWQQKWEIGLLGRGFGTAGPSSQYRLDGGQNHWTENIYLDIFEETGFVGISLYLALISLILKHLLSLQSSHLRRSAIIVLAAFSVSGLFINYYTGQVGIYLMWLIIGLTIGDKNEKNSN
jgi:O-antigen ligase